MDWDKVIENLRNQVKFYSSQANSLLNSGQVGGYEKSKRWSACADTASILLSALVDGRVND